MSLHTTFSMRMPMEFQTFAKLRESSYDSFITKATGTIIESRDAIASSFMTVKSCAFVSMAKLGTLLPMNRSHYNRALALREKHEESTDTRTTEHRNMMRD